MLIPVLDSALMTQRGLKHAQKNCRILLMASLSMRSLMGRTTVCWDNSRRNRSSQFSRTSAFTELPTRQRWRPDGTPSATSRAYTAVAAGGRGAGAGGTFLAATTSARVILTRVRLVSTTHCVCVRERRTPSASVSPPSIRERTTTRVPISTPRRKSAARVSIGPSLSHATVLAAASSVVATG